MKTLEELYPCPKEYNCLREEVNGEDRSWFYQELKKYGNFTSTLWLLSPEPYKNTVLPVNSLEDIVLCGAQLEVKCPFTQRDCTIEKAVLSGSFYIRTMMNLTKNTVTGIKCRDNYIYVKRQSEILLNGEQKKP